MRKTQRLRALLRRKDKILVVLGAPNAFYAKLIEAAGFDTCFVGTNITGGNITALPDAGVITLTESLWMAQWIARAVEMPVIVDADTGFGGLMSVRRTVQEFIRIGVAGIRIEDQLPSGKRFGGMSGKEVIPIEEAVGKYRAAVDAKAELDPDFVLIARTDARDAVGRGDSSGRGLDEAIRRLNAYREAGADLVHLEGPHTVEEIRKARAEIAGPLVCSLFNLPAPLSIQEHQELGLMIAWYSGIFDNVLKATAWDFLRDLRERGLAAYLEFVTKSKDNPFATDARGKSFDLTGLGQLKEIEERYLPKEELKKYEASQGIYNPTSKQ